MSRLFIDNDYSQTLDDRLRESDDMASLQAAFDHVVADSATHIGDDSAYGALAAAEVVAAIHRHANRDTFATAMRSWCAARTADDALVNDARRAARLVFTGSDLPTQWRSQGRSHEFEASIRTLQQRLGKDALFQH